MAQEFLDKVYKYVDVWPEFIFEEHAKLLDERTHAIPVAAIILYGLMIYLWPKFFPAGHKGFRTLVKWPAAFWNLFLSLMSMCILFGVGKPYFEMFRDNGFTWTLCDSEHMIQDRPSSMLFWTYVFVLSKYFELFDTTLLLLKDPHRKLQFLHWYHHMTVLAFTWYAEYYRFAAGFHFILFNAFVHSLMYFYYFLTEVGWRPPRFIQMFLTTLQILQMVWGITVNGIWTYIYFRDGDCGCRNPKVILISCVLMYGSYLFLFCEFFFKRYILSDKKPAPAAKKGDNKKKN